MTLFGRMILFCLERWPRLFSRIARRYMTHKVSQAVAHIPRVSRQQARIMRQGALGHLRYHDLESQANIEIFRRVYRETR